MQRIDLANPPLQRNASPASRLRATELHSLCIDMVRYLVTRYVAIAAALLLASLPSYATKPLMDLIEYDGRATIVWPDDKPWLDLPRNERLAELQRGQRCSAIGGPRAKWRLADDQLWLVGLFKCGGDIPLESVYGGNGEPILATWITGNLITHKGKLLCRDFFGVGVFETTIVLRIENGVLKQAIESSNRRHPAVPTVDDLRKMLRPYGIEKEAEAIVAASDWDCLTQAQQIELRGNSISNPAVQGTQFPRP